MSKLRWSAYLSVVALAALGGLTQVRGVATEKSIGANGPTEQASGKTTAGALTFSVNVGLDGEKDPLPATTICRPSAGPCDVAEYSTGVDGVCPPDRFLQPETHRRGIVVSVGATNDVASVFDVATDTVVGSVLLPGSNSHYGCQILDDGSLAFVSSYQARGIRVVDPAGPALAGGVNPIPTTISPLQLALSADQQFLLASSISSQFYQGIATIGVASRAQVGYLPSPDRWGLSSVEACSDSTVLTATVNQGVSGHSVYRLTIDGSGNLTYTGESIPSTVGPCTNGTGYEACAPSGGAAVFGEIDFCDSSHGLRSLEYPPLAAVDTPRATAAQVFGVAINPSGTAAYVRSSGNSGGLIEGFAFDSATGMLGATPFVTIPVATVNYAGKPYMAFTPDGAKLYVPEGEFLNVYDPVTGALLASIALPPGTTGVAVCVPKVIMTGSDVCRPSTGPCDPAESCSGQSVECPPEAPPSCDDGNPCTDDSCDDASGCVHSSNTASCDDGSVCTAVDVCSDGQCVGTEPTNCDDGDPCTSDVCNPATGACKHTGTPGAACEDGNPCTQQDVCAPPPTSCTLDENFDSVPPGLDSLPAGWTHSETNSWAGRWSVWSGGGQSGVQSAHLDFWYGSWQDYAALITPPFTARGNGEVTFFNNRDYDYYSSPYWCTSPGVLEIKIGDGSWQDIIDAGGVWVTGGYNGLCDSPYNLLYGRSAWCGADPPYSGWVQTIVKLPAAADGQSVQLRWLLGASYDTYGAWWSLDTVTLPLPCPYACTPGPAAPDGSPCEDQNACTMYDACSNGQCVGGTTGSCDDGNVCTDDSCSPASGCVYTNNTAPCNDGNVCTTNDMCSAGACVGGAVLACDDGNVCTDDSCSPASGCVYTNNTAPCNDGNACTTNDTCDSGACRGGAPPACSDGNPCTTDTCNPVTGCVHTGSDGTDNSCGQVTDTSYCALPTALCGSSPTTPQFRLIALQDPTFSPSQNKTVMNDYVLNASNPGQFYYNVFYAGTPDSPVNLTIGIPYPFVTSGANPIQVHDGVTLSGGCYVPSPSLSAFTITTDGGNVSSSGYPVILRSDYKAQDLGNTTSVYVTGTVPASGLVYVTIHLDYGLKKVTGWQQYPFPGGTTLRGPDTNLDNVLDGLGDAPIYLVDQYPYGFDFSGGSITHAYTPSNCNVFKKNPGVNGNTLRNGTGNPVRGVTVQFFNPKGVLIGTTTTDSDGFYMFTYKHTGKAADYTVKLPDYGKQKTVTLKANGYARADFEDLP